MFASRLFATLATVCMTALLLAPANADTLEIHMRINQDVEDIAEQEWGGDHRPGQVQKGDIAIDLGMRNTVGYSDELVDVPQRIALLFRNVDIPAGSTINSANIQFTVHDGDSTIWTPDNDRDIGTLAPLEASISIYGLLDSDPGDLPSQSVCLNPNQCVPNTIYTLTDLTGGQCVGGNCLPGGGPMGGVGPDISNVTAPVHWEDIPTWTTGDVNGNGVEDPGDYDDIIGAAGPDQLTPDLSPILQELTDLEGWAPNNSMVFMIDPMFLGVDEETGENLYARGGRDAVSFCSFPAFPPLCDPVLEPPVLLIDFTPPSAFLADFNNDGVVDGADLTDPTDGWEARFGVDLEGSNFLDWQSEFGSGVAPLSATQAVPEPSTLLLGIVAFMALFRRRILLR